MVYNWNKMVTITVPVGLNGWVTRGRVIINGREFTFPIGVETQVPEPVADHIRKLQKMEEDGKPTLPPSGCVDTEARQQITALTEEILTTEAKAELAALCPEIFADPDVKILYDPDRTEVAASEFANNTEIEVAYFPNVTTVGQKAFEYATNLKYIVLPKATTLPNYSFRNCENLAYVYLPNVQSVAAQVFASTSQLKELDLPEVTSVKMRSFDGMSGLKVVSMPKLTKTSSSCFTLCPNLTEVNLPLVEELGGSDFDGCSMLIKMELPVTKTISAGTFRSSGLTTLILRNNILCTLGSVSALANTPIASGTGYIYVPAALIESYKVAANWSTYAAQFRAIEDYPDICAEDADECITKAEAAALIDSKLEGAGGGASGGGSNIVFYYDGTTYTCNVPFDKFEDALKAGSPITFIADDNSGTTVNYYHMVHVQRVAGGSVFVIEAYDRHTNDVRFTIAYESSGITETEYS